VDSSLPVLVARLPDRAALARLVRAALRHDVVHVELASAPERTEAHTLDLQIEGSPPLALLAEPVGAAQNGQYPLRLRPLHRAQGAQLYALLRAESVGSSIAPRTTLPPVDAAPIARAMAGAAPPPVIQLTQPLHIRPAAGAPAAGRQVSSPLPARPPPRPTPSRPPDDPRKTAPVGVDLRKTVPTENWVPPEALEEPDAKTEIDPDLGADAEDPSLSVPVVFDSDDAPGFPDTPRTADPAPLPADEDEPSLSVSVIFEPDVLAEAMRTSAPDIAEEPASEPPPTLSDHIPVLEAPLEEKTAPEPFFDDVLANFPTPQLDSIPPDEDGPNAVFDTHPDDDGIVQVPPPPDEEIESAVESLVDKDDEGDNDDTLVRVSEPSPISRPLEKPAQIVSAQARIDPEHTPTLETHRSPGTAAGAAASGEGRKKKSTRRKPKSPSSSGSAVTKKRGSVAEIELLDEAPTAERPKSAVAAAVTNGADVPIAHGRADDPALGRRIAEGKYVIESLIGAGAAGAVYRATHRELRRTVAIKLLHPHYQQDPQFMTSFRGEALAASQLDHPNVMRVLDFGQEPDGLVYIVMEYLSGHTLQSLLDEERRLPTERAVEVMIQVCAALSVAHDHGIIHRDIKPDNIMLVPSRNDEGRTFELVKVCDFGIAALQNPRAEDADLVAEEHVIAGTPEYMSPEQARGIETDARSDVYACGICLYELVTGRPPFIGEHPGEILIKQLEDIPKPPSQVVKGLDPILEEIILRAIQKDPSKRHQSAREMRVELKELIEPGEGYNKDQDELSIVENVPVLDDPASGFPGFFIALSSAVLRFGRFERGHHEAAQAMKELEKQLRSALRGRSELTFARRDVQKTLGYCVMSGTAEIVDLRRLLGSQLMGSFGLPFIQELANKGVVALTLREGIPDVELRYIIEMLLGALSHEELRKEVLSKPLRHISVLFVTDVVGRERKLPWKVGLCMARLARDLHALCNVRGISLKKMRETRDQLIGAAARLLTRGEEVRQFIYNADLVDEAVANLRGFSSFQVAPLVIERLLHESCVETVTCLFQDFDSDKIHPEVVHAFLQIFAQRLIAERSPKSDAALAELCQRKIIDEDELPRDLIELIRAQTLADALVRDPSQFLLALDKIGDAASYSQELTRLEAAMANLARRSEAVALLAVMSTLARHAKGAGKPGLRENAALRTMKSMIDQERLLPIATTLLVGPVHQREAARQLIVIAGSVGASALYDARGATTDPAARAVFVSVLRDTGPAGWTLLSHVLPRMELRNDAEIALIEDLLRAMPERADAVLGEAVAKFLTHPLLRPTALSVIVPLWGERARKPLVEALEYAEEPARIIALGELRRLRAIDEYVYGVIERFLTMRGSAGEELRAAAAGALADAAAPLRARAVQLLSKAVEGKRGFVAMLRGDGNSDEGVVVVEAMGRALLALDRNEGVRVLKGRLSRSDGIMRARLTALLQTL
jgi:serine/threonine-protein kinase